MIAKIVKQCGYCRSIVYVENKKEVVEKITDGRRHLTVECLVCGETINICSKLC